MESIASLDRDVLAFANVLDLFSNVDRLVAKVCGEDARTRKRRTRARCSPTILAPSHVWPDVRCPRDTRDWVEEMDLSLKTIKADTSVRFFETLFRDSITLSLGCR